MTNIWLHGFILYGQGSGWMGSKVRHYFNKEYWHPFRTAPLCISNSLATRFFPIPLTYIDFAFHVIFFYLNYYQYDKKNFIFKDIYLYDIYIFVKY